MLPFKLISEDWKYGSAGNSPLSGVSYSSDMKNLVYELWRVGMLSHFTVYGSKLKGIYSIRSKKLEAEVHNLWHATIVEEGDYEKAEEVSWLLYKCFGKPSVQDAANAKIKNGKWLSQEMVRDLRHKTGYLGGIQWSPPEYDFKHGVKVENAFYYDLAEAYTNCLLKRQLPRKWEYRSSADYPTDAIQDQDSIYWVEIKVPDHLPWGFPIGRETVNGEYTGFATGEEIISAQIPKSHVRLLGKWRPVTWGPHPAADVLSMPRAVRKRVGITIYGLHAKREERTSVGISDSPSTERGVVSEPFKDAYIVWSTNHQPRPFARLDYAALTTSRVRSAVVRAVLDMPGVHMVYVDGMITEHRPYEDDLWPGIIEWNLKASGPCTIWGPGVYHFEDGVTTTKRGLALREWLLMMGN